MKKLLVLALVLAFAVASQAGIISLADEGSTILLAPGTTITLEILSDVALIGLDAQVSVAGGDVIVAAMSPADAPGYGWDAVSFPIPPVGVGTASVEVGGATFTSAPAGAVAYVDVLYTGGTQVVSIASAVGFGGTYDTSYGSPDFSAGVVTLDLIPEPATVVLLSLGGLLLRRKK